MGKSTKSIHWEEDRKNASESLNNVEAPPRENFTNQKALYIFCRKTQLLVFQNNPHFLQVRWTGLYHFKIHILGMTKQMSKSTLFHQPVWFLDFAFFWKVI